MPVSQSIAIDLRGLNYQVRTGVNIYCLCFLRELSKIKQDFPNLQITGIGLQPAILQQLEAEFSWLSGLFTSLLSLPEYTGLPFSQNRWHNLTMLLVSLLFGKLRFAYLPKFDYLFLPQAKPLWLHPNTKQICVFHDLWSVIKPETTVWSNRWFTNRSIYQLIATNSYQIWAVSWSTARDLWQFLSIPETKIKLVYSARPDLECTFEQTQTGTTTDNLPESYILALSGIEKRKNWHNLLLAYKVLLVQQLTTVPLVLAGRIVDLNYYQELRNLVQQLNLDKQVQWVIDPDEKQKAQLLQNCLFLAYPSIYEGFGFPILEAFYYGKTVLTSRISSMPEIAKDAAVYVNPLNYLDIARGLQILLHNQSLRTTLENNTAKNLAQFSWQELRLAILRVLNLD